MNSKREECDWMADELSRTGRLPVDAQLIAGHEPGVAREESLVVRGVDPAIGLADDDSVVAVDGDGGRADWDGQGHASVA